MDCFEFCLIFIIPLSFLDWPTAIGQHNNKRNTGMMNNVDFDFNDVIIVDDDHSNRCLFFFVIFFIKNYIYYYYYYYVLLLCVVLI